jgi:hypothetical protein
MKFLLHPVPCDKRARAKDTDATKPSSVQVLHSNLHSLQKHEARQLQHSSMKKCIAGRPVRRPVTNVHSVFDKMTRGCFMDFALSHDLHEVTGFGQAWR